ncbi:ATP-binding cassette subfamily B protein [Sinobacterium caligoides]|uniref:ATP-binding cassette subfamily B protein n=1 Tax=Sinobacterium caligoides TaxID=933926 RepID=A0A3N2DYB6_9GAMM|nr:ABC transporter ATP-binding protein/permease [Sinobacterium caligoides]ROS04843.1 ATP-binding cassette subfamily B protein [Sinobacterium caligoides]
MRQKAKNASSGDSQESQQADWRVISSLIPYLMVYPVRVIFALLLLVVAKGANVLIPVVLKYIVDHLDRSGLPESVTTVVAVPVALVLAYGALRFSAVLFGELRDAVFGRVAERSLSAIGLKLFQQLHSLDLDFHLSRKTGAITRDMERGISGISFLLRSLVFSVAPIIIELIMVGWVLAATTTLSYALVVIAGVVSYVVFSVWATHKRSRFVRKANVEDSRANTRAVDSLLNFETVKYFNNEAYEADLYRENLRRREDAKVHNHLGLALLNSGQALIIALSVTLVMYMAATQVAAGEMSLGDLAMVNAFMLQVFMPLNILGFIYREVRRCLIDVESMFKLMTHRPKIVDCADAINADEGFDGISVSDIHFSYDGQRKVLDGVSFEVPKGKKVALVGASGSGKSTLGRLLFRFYDVDQGRISCAGRDIRQLKLASWRQLLGVVPQDTVLFNDTLGNNIRYGNPASDEAELTQVLAHADLADFIGRLPEGLDTQVGERGLKLSGGEKQRVSIARMLLKKPRIMLFDEATSSLDSRSEQAILQAFSNVAKEHTSLVIAHRLSTIIDADNIVVLDQGKVVEQGTHQQLLSQQGYYYSLWQLQQS